VKRSVRVGRFTGVSLFLFLCIPVLQGQSFLAEIKAEQNPVKRSELALSFADDAFSDARKAYLGGNIKAGDQQLEDMMTALKECVTSLDLAHKGRFYKQAEMKVANLQRRLDGVVDSLSMEERGWADYTKRKVEEIHESLLAGVMKK
jgi:hypothetical protein